MSKKFYLRNNDAELIMSQIQIYTEKFISYSVTRLRWRKLSVLMQYIKETISLVVFYMRSGRYFRVRFLDMRISIKKMMSNLSENFKPP